MNKKPFLRILTLPAVLLLALTARAGKTIGNYSYDRSGNVSSIGPESDGLTSYYYYDSAGRLIRFARKANTTAVAVLEEKYEYDAYGNVTKLVRGSAVDTIVVDAGTNRLGNATYDAAGNLATYDGVAYHFDAVGTLTRKSGTWGSAFYIYTADDERIGIEGPEGSWRYTIRDIDHKVLREWSAQSWNGSLGWMEDYLYRDGKLAAAVRPDTQGGTRHFHLDHLHTPRLITGPQGQQYASHDYFPFGREITNPEQETIQHGFDTPEPMKFTGQERDFAGSFGSAPVDYMHARYYLPHSGRFSSVDPVLGLKKAMRNPQAWNRYAYVGNNPLKFTDPTGREAELPSNCANTDNPCQELKDLRDSVPPEARIYVQVTTNSSGNVVLNANLLNAGRNSTTSDNYLALRQVANSPATVQFNSTARSVSMRVDGKIQSYDFAPVTPENGFYGIALSPRESTNGKRQVFVNPFMSAVDRAGTTGHELYGHMRRYILGLPWSHEPEYDESLDAYVDRSATGDAIRRAQAEAEANARRP